MFAHGGDVPADAAKALGAVLRAKGPRDFLAHFGHANVALALVVMCALRRRIETPGENPGRQTVVPAESTWSGSGGDEWAEALQEKAVLDGQRAMRAAA